MKEDEFVQAWIENMNRREERNTCRPEVHYNHYGDRGVVDLVSTEFLGTRSGGEAAYEHLFEVKGSSAVANVTGANEIVRQFTRMCKYYYKDDSVMQPVSYGSVTAELTFLPTTSVIEHVWKNRHIYHQLGDLSIEGLHSGVDAKTLVTFRHPDEIPPVHITPRFDTPDELLTHAETNNSAVHQQFVEFF